MTQEELKGIEARCKAATPAPELIRYEHGGGRALVIGPKTRTLVADYYDEADREFYHNARTDIPKLLAHIRGLEESSRSLIQNIVEHGSHDNWKALAKAIHYFDETSKETK